MAITIGKSTGNRVSLADAKQTSYYNLSSLIKIKPDGDDVILEFFAGGDKLVVSRFLYTDISSPAPTSIGNCTYDEAGGGVDDEWTKSTHGLAVGDGVIFTAVGTGATGYAIATKYYVAAVPDSGTFTLSATLGGDAIEGTDDSVGTWTLVRSTAQNMVDVLDALLILA